MKTVLRFLAILLTLTAANTWAQPREEGYDPDRAYEFARDLAFQGAYIEARDTLTKILSDFPEYTDVESLLAKTYSWEGNYDRARRHFNRITSRERNLEEVWVACVKNEMYAGNTSLAVGLANKGLMYLGESQELQNLRQKLLNEKENIPGREEKVEKETFNYFALTNAVEAFDGAFDPMVYSSLEYQRKTAVGKIIPRLNYNYRFQIPGLQYEMDLYPKFSEKTYAYLNYGYSDAEIFPAHRFGAELFTGFKGGLEASLGMRYLDFRESQATLLTGSFGLYKGNYYLSFRPFLSLFKDRSPGVSGSILARKYLKNANEYLGLRAIYGFNPELRQLRSGTELLAETLLFVESQELQFEYQMAPGSGKHRYRAQLGISRQEFVFEPGSFFWVFRGGIRYQVGF